MKKLIVLLLGLLFLGGCNEAAESTSAAEDNAGTLAVNSEAEITELPTDTGATDPLSGYTQSAFSKYIYVASSGERLLIDFNFFPEGSDFDSQQKRVTIPCEYTQAQDVGADASVNAPVEETPCSESISVDLSAAEFSFVGLVFSLDASLDVFDSQFEFKITTVGFVDSLDNSPIEIESEDATLENVYNLVMDRRI